MGDYWEECGEEEYSYRGETFYTITPVPYYYTRRETFKKMILQTLKGNNIKSVCDFGCGDGYYMRYFKEQMPKCIFYGVDASVSMIKRAEENCKNYGDLQFELSSDGIQGNKKFDLIYSVAVFAHVNDQDVMRLFQNLNSHLNKDGYIVLCEQVGKKQITDGNTYVRREGKSYIHALEKSGFTVENQYLVDFWLHRIWFERKIAKRFYKNMPAESEHDKRIMANTKRSFRLLSWLFTKLSVKHVFHKIDGRWGYAVIIAQNMSGHLVNRE